MTSNFISPYTFNVLESLHACQKILCIRSELNAKYDHVPPTGLVIIVAAGCIVYMSFHIMSDMTWVSFKFGTAMASSHTTRTVIGSDSRLKQSVSCLLQSVVIHCQHPLMKVWDCNCTYNPVLLQATKERFVVGLQREVPSEEVHVELGYSEYQRQSFFLQLCIFLFAEDTVRYENATLSFSSGK